MSVGTHLTAAGCVMAWGLLDHAWEDGGLDVG